MGRFLVARLAQSALTLLLVAIVVFFMVRVTGDPLASMLPADAPDETIELVTKNYGFDKPLHYQFAIYMKNLVTLDLGKSITARRPVTDLIVERIIPSVQLAGVAMLIAVAIAFPTAVISVLHRGGWLDRLAQTVAFAGLAAPHFWIGLIFINIFAVQLRLLPAAGVGGGGTFADLPHLLMPSLTLGAGTAAAMMRLLRSGMLEAMDSEFVKFARIKGVTEGKVIWVHALRNALVPWFTYSAIVLATLITGGVTVEVVFNWPGIGRLAYQGIVGRDFPLVQGIVLFAATLVVAVNFVVDLLYASIDPRLRLTD